MTTCMKDLAEKYSGGIQEALEQATLWCQKNIYRYLPPSICKIVPYDRIRWEIDEGEQMLGRDMAFTSEWVLKVNLSKIKWHFKKQEYLKRWSNLAEASYDIQSVIIHEIVEGTLRSYFNFNGFSAIFHLVSQIVEHENRQERGLGLCPTCSYDLLFLQNRKNIIELLEIAEGTYKNPSIKQLLLLTGQF